MKKFVMIAFATLSVMATAHAGSLQSEIDQAYNDMLAANAAAELVYQSELSAAEIRYQATVNSTDSDDVAELFNRAFAQRSADLAAASDKYLAAQRAHAARYTETANAACVRHTGRNCRWN